jgi:hypothetical protein
MSKLEPLIVTGELIYLSPEDRIRFYVQVCESMGLNPLTRPLQFFEQIDRNGKRVLILYALRGACVQLSKLHSLTVKISDAIFSHDAVMFTATVTNPQGREDSAIGATSLKGLEGKEYADAIMAAQTKAKRRGVLDFTGSGLLDESEVEGMKGSVIEVTSEQLKDYTPIPAAPAPSDAPATEFVPETYHNIKPEVIKAGEDLTKRIVESIQSFRDIVNNEKYELAADAIGPDMSKNATVPSPAEVAAAQEQFTEAQITSRLNSYRRDTLQQGGMRPSKGFGIAAKWAKFLAKNAPAKTIDQYVTVLRVLDGKFQEVGANGVVEFIEREIA